MPLGEKKAKEEKGKREREEDAWPLRCDTDDAVLLGGYGTLFVGGKVAGQGEQGKTGNSRRKESRKELFGASGNRINIASIGRFRAETRTKGRRELTYVWRQLSSSRSDFSLSITAARGNPSACRSKFLFKAAARSLFSNIVALVATPIGISLSSLAIRAKIIRYGKKKKHCFVRVARRDSSTK